MIACKFCDKKAQNNYLYLSCSHLSCLSCTFLRTDFSTQELECCEKFTIIQGSAMELIVKNKRNLRSENSHCSKKDERAEGKIGNNPQRKQNESCQEPKFQDISNFQSFNSDSQIRHVPKISRINLETSPQKLEQQENENDFEHILKIEISRIKKGFDTQRELLKEQEQNRIKDLIQVYEQQINTIDKQTPISHAKLQKFNASLTKRSSVTHRTLMMSQKSHEETSRMNSNKAASNYNHILKRLETNQQRMRQRLQKHLGDLY